MTSTLTDVAARAGVSPKTVSRVVNDEPGVSPLTRARVLAALEETGYSPDTAARSLRTGRSGVIGLAVPELGQPFFAEIADRIAACARRRGLAVVLGVTGERGEGEAEFFASSTALDGVILYWQGLSPRALAQEAQRCPLVLLGENEHAAVDRVTMDNERGIDLALAHLTALGRERIAVIGVPDPARLLDLYHHAASTLNLIRAFTKGGYADLRQVHRWNQGFMSNPAYARYESLAEDIHRAIKFMGAAGVDFETLRDVDLYSSHEALLLEYESAMTRIDSRTGEPYNTSAHFLWAGERTREEEGAHIELLSRVRNPIGIKLGPSTTPDQMLILIDRLNPDGEEGRLSFITRMGAGRIREALPPLLEAARKDGRPLTWMTDPMHGNTITSSTGYKTRRFETVMDEVRGFFEAHEASGTVPGGLHVELTGDDVTEVIGGSEHIDDESLRDRYETLVDPRLNHQQSLEMAFQVAQYLAKCSSHEE